MPVTFGAPAPAADDTPARPIPVDVVWMRADDDGRLGGLMFLGPLAPADHATQEATGREDQWQITGGRRRKTLDAWYDGDPDDQAHHARVTPEQAARALADWCGFTGRPLDVRVIDETRM